MLDKDSQNEILVKTKQGDFKLFKDGKLAELPKDELIVPEDDLVLRQPTKPISNFYFDVDDEHDIRKLSQIGQADSNRSIKEFIEVTVRNIVGQAGLDEAALQNSQLRNIITSRLKDVRSLAETKEALTRLDNISLSQEQINEIVRLVEDKRDKVEQTIKAGQAAESIEPRQLAKSKPIVKTPLEAPKEIKPDEQPKAAMAGVKYDKVHEIVGDKELTKHITTGPVEEIKALSLKEFRQLGTSPKEAAERILQKIDLLGDESLIKKAEGIKAWNDSEVYKLYLNIGATSMAEKKPVEQVIREYKQANKPYLAPEEFNEVADLNRKLSY